MFPEHQDEPSSATTYLAAGLFSSFGATVLTFAAALLAERLNVNVGYGLIRCKPVRDWWNHERDFCARVLANTRASRWGADMNIGAR